MSCDTQSFSFWILSVAPLAAGGEHAYERALHTFEAIGGNADCTIIGSKHRMPVTSAVMLNGILIRELDLNDAYVGPGQMGHPSDNIAVALSVGEKQRSSGLDVLASVIAGYELYCRIQDIIVGRGPWDHVTASALAAPAIAGRLLEFGGRPARQRDGAIGRSWATPYLRFVPDNFRMPRPWPMPSWLTRGRSAACFASRGTTGPLSIFEGKGGSIRHSLPGPILTC